MLSRTILHRSLLRASSSSSPTSCSTIRLYGSTGGKGDSNTHGGQSPTERNMGETGSASPSSDDVAKSDGAFNSDPNPKSASEKVDSDLPEGESMKNTASNAAMSKQFSSQEKDVPKSQSSSNNKSTDSEGGRRSQRGPGSDV